MAKLLGDKVAEVLDKTGITKIAKKAGCTGCAQRQARLNELHQKLLGGEAAPREVGPEGNVVPSHSAHFQRPTIDLDDPKVKEAIARNQAKLAEMTKELQD